MGKISKLYTKALAAVGLRQIKNSSGIIPGTDSYQVLKEWIESPLKAGGSFDWDLRNKMNSLRQKARGLAIGNPLVVQYLQLLEQNVIGPRGIRLQAQVRNSNGDLDKLTNDTIETAWSDFWSDPWVDGRMSGVAGEQLLLTTVAVDGEAFVRRIRSSKYKYGLKLQMIDPDLIDHQFSRPRGTKGENEIRLGIEVDEWSRCEAIWVWSGALQDINIGVPRQRTRIPAADIIHLYDPKRINQTRGITWLNSVITSLNVLDGYVEASLLGARAGACSMPLFKHTNADLYDVDGSGSAKAQTFTMELNAGGGLTLPPGLELQEFKPNQSIIGFGEFTKESKRWTSSGLCTSYNALANDLEGVSFSSMRSGLQIERDTSKCLQQWWIDRFRSPVFGWFLNDGLLSGGLQLDSRNPLKYLLTKWVPRGWPWIDPLKDVNAAVVAIKNGLGSRTGYLGEQGKDFEEICEEQKDENEIAKTCGLDFSDVDRLAADAALKLAEESDDEDLTPEEQVTDKKKTQALILAHRRGA